MTFHVPQSFSAPSFAPLYSQNSRFPSRTDPLIMSSLLNSFSVNQLLLSDDYPDAMRLARVFPVRWKANYFWFNASLHIGFYSPISFAIRTINFSDERFTVLLHEIELAAFNKSADSVSPIEHVNVRANGTHNCFMPLVVFVHHRTLASISILIFKVFPSNCSLGRPPHRLLWALFESLS